jgi:hypothetical protein
LHYFDGPTTIADGRTPCDTPHPPGLRRIGPLVLFAAATAQFAGTHRPGSCSISPKRCVPAGFSCRGDACQVRQSGLLSGAVAYQVEPLEPPSAGQLTCTVHA